MRTLMRSMDQFQEHFSGGGPDPLASIDSLCRQLEDQRRNGPEAWKKTAESCRSHPAHKLLLEDPFTNRAFTKPRGYAGDAVMMDYVYGHPDAFGNATPVTLAGRSILTYTAGASQTARAVRWRRERAAREIEDAVTRRGRARVLVFACGHLREAELMHPDLLERAEIVAADLDATSLATVQAAYASKTSVQCQRISVMDVVKRDHDFEPGFDLVYSLGLFDYLSAKVASRLVAEFWKLVGANGRLLIGNFHQNAFGPGYMEACMDWWLQYRGHDEIRSWAPAGGWSNVFDDPFGQVSYLWAGKA